MRSDLSWKTIRLACAVSSLLWVAIFGIILGLRAVFA